MSGTLSTLLVRDTALVPREGYRGIHPNQRWFPCSDLYVRVERGATKHHLELATLAERERDAQGTRHPGTPGEAREVQALTAPRSASAAQQRGAGTVGADGPSRPDTPSGCSPAPDLSRPGDPRSADRAPISPSLAPTLNDDRLALSAPGRAAARARGG